MLRLVILESPFAGDVDRNRTYLQLALRDSLLRGEAPFASHGLYTVALDDEVSDERQTGIAAGLAWARQADATVVYEDLGVSGGMVAGIQHAIAAGRPIEFRRLPGWSARERNVSRG